MIGQQTMPLEARYHRLEVTNRWVIGIAVAAVVALAALAGWVALDRFGQTDAERTVASVTTAWTENDPALLAELYDENAVLVTGTARDNVARGIDEIIETSAFMATAGFAPEIAGPVVEYGNLVVVPVHSDFSDGTGYDAIGLFTLNDEGLVVRHEDVEVTISDE